MRLRSKVLSGFFVLALMLSLAGAWSIYELRSTSSAVHDLLAENYRSINAGKRMLEALEREDSGVLLVLLGRWNEGRAILASADSLFQSEFQVAAHNITIPGESAHVDAIATKYRAYKGEWENLFAGAGREGDLTWYFESTHRAFLDAKAAVGDLIDLNDRVMYDTASQLRQGADRALMPGIVAIVAALVFSLLFSYFVTIFMVNPIVRITDAIGRHIKRQEDFDVRLEARDELSELVDSIRTLISQARTGDRRSTPTP